MLRLFIDECLSPRLEADFRAKNCDAVHPRSRGALGGRDDQILALCLKENRVIVTHNIRDFRKLTGKEPLHPGLIVLCDAAYAQTKKNLEAALGYIEQQRGGESPQDWMINKVVAVEDGGKIRHEEFPPLK